MDQHVAAAARIDGRLRRIRIAGDHDAAIGRIEAIAVALHCVLGRKCRHRDLRILVNDARPDVVRVHATALRKVVLVTVGVGARLDVDAVRGEQMLRHRLHALRAVDLEREFAADRPRGKDEIRVANRVIRMQMRRERDAQLHRVECGDFLVAERRARAADDAGAEIDEVGDVVDDDCGRGAGTFGDRTRITGAEQHHQRARCQDLHSAPPSGVPGASVPVKIREHVRLVLIPAEPVLEFLYADRAVLADHAHEDRAARAFRLLAANAPLP